MSTIELISVDLSKYHVQLPATGVGMVVAQPHIDLTPQEPYRCPGRSQPAQLDAIASALEVARQAPHGAGKTHFTVFPEYGIPAPAGVELVERTLCKEDWPNQSVVIGGTDGLNKERYTALANQYGSHVGPASSPERVPDGQWVNCGMVWIKGRNGKISRWLQPKLYPSWGEEDVSNSQMFTGNSIFLFKGIHDDGTPYHFVVLICFDWIAETNSSRPWRKIVQILSNQASGLGANLPISWLFVIQHNRSPSHPSFMTEVNEFFDHRFAPNVRRERACLLFANSAGREEPGRIQQFGSTSVIMSDQTRFELPACPKTFCTEAHRLRGHKLIGHHKDLVFREGGACVHSFEQTNPDQVGPGPAARKGPLRNTAVHAVGDCTDPRVPGRGVPASVKWINDELDTIDGMPRTYACITLAGELAEARTKTHAELRKIEGAIVDRSIRLASPVAGLRADADGRPRLVSADHWEAPERAAVEHLLDTLSILRVCSGNCRVAGGATHATLGLIDTVFDVIAVLGETHEDCREHCTAVGPRGCYPVLLVSRDRENDEWFRRRGSFVEPQPNEPLKERDFTDPDRGVLHLGYRDVLRAVRESDSVRQAKEKIVARLHE